MNLIKDIKAIVKRYKYSKYLPNKQKNDDIYIVEFPKSGITWFSTLIANINLTISKSEQKVTYYNIQQLIPDIHMNRNIHDEPIWSLPKCRFIKSHSPFCPYYNHVIYLVRNPVSVMHSYYKYMQMLGQFEGTFNDFVRDEKLGLDKWKEHVSSWLLNGESSQRIHVVKYEDLQKNPIQTLSDLYKNLGFDINKSIIEEVIKLSEFNVMKESENFYKKFNPNSSLIFMREGKSKINVEKYVEKYILDNTKDIRNKIGYIEK